MGNLKNAYALIIGVGDEELDTVNDAIDINEILIDEEFAGYSKENVILVTGKNATRNGILNGFKKLHEKTDENCGICSYCISLKKTDNTLIQNQIIKLLEKAPISSREIENQLIFSTKEILSALQVLLESEKIKINNL